MAEKNTINFTILHHGHTHQVQTHFNQYYSLMTLISDKLAIPGFGLCCGMGSCGTCMVQLGYKYIAAQKMVLSCDVRINDDLANVFVTVPDRVY